MGKPNPPLAACRLSLILLAPALAASASVPLDSFQPAGYFDTAVMASGLRNAEDTDAIYVAPLGLDTGGAILRIDVEAGLSPSNAVALAFGTPQEPDALRIVNEDGRWTILTGGEKRPFDTPLPPPLAGTHAYRLVLTVGMTAKLYATAVKIYEDGVHVPAPSLSIANYPLSIIPPPSAWTQVTVNLRGQATLKALRCSLGFPPSLILLR